MVLHRSQAAAAAAAAVTSADFRRAEDVVNADAADV